MAETVLVTGGTGFVAGWCIVELLQRGYTVRTTVRSLSKEAAVRAAAAIALGQIGDEAAVVPLVEILSGSSSKKKSKARDDEFLMRAAAQSLGEIRSHAGVTGLIATLNNETNAIDVRRAAAQALGLIGDTSAMPALKAAIASNDPYLAQTAKEALRRMH